MNHAQTAVLVVILVGLSAAGAIAAISPRTLVTHLGGPKELRAPTRERLLRAAGILFLIGAVLLCLEWWRVR